MIEWRQIPSEPEYLASSDGQIKRADTDRVRKLSKTPRGYSFVTMNCGRGHRFRSVHGLVAEAFLGARPAGQDIRHLDGDPGNNRVENLAYGTALENAQDRENHGRTCRGHADGNAKITDDEVACIRVLHDRRMLNQYELAAMFSISQAQVNNIVLRKQRTAPAYADAPCRAQNARAAQ